MYAIVRPFKGKYYLSPVFGEYYDDYSSATEFEKKYELAKFLYYVVFDENKKTLIKQYLYNELFRQVLIIDADVSDWNVNKETETGEVLFTNYNELHAIIDGTLTVPQKFYDYDGEYNCSEVGEIRNETDAKSLLDAFMYFHDGYIEKIEEVEDKLTVHFNSMWGCDVEIIFEGDVSYDLGIRGPESDDRWWYDASISLKDGYVWLIDDENATPDDYEGYCWFKAKHMYYRIIPS